MHNSAPEGEIAAGRDRKMPAPSSILVLATGSVVCGSKHACPICSVLGVFLFLVLLVGGCHRGPDPVLGSGDSQSPSIAGAEPLGPEGQAELRTILESGSLADLRWPDFSDCREDVAKFYNLYGGALPWVSEMQATMAHAGPSVWRISGRQPEIRRNRTSYGSMLR